jgi:glucan phosphoethanolaminetransferase (alkaline phosphatase superfamily)
MNNQEVQLILMNITLVLVAVLALLFVFRVIRVLTNKEIKDKEDTMVVLLLLGIICLFAYCSYKIKEAFKKDKNTVV